VRPSSTGEFVFVLQPDHTVKQRQVVRGQAVGDRVQVVSGLQLGEHVITEGADRLRDGARVILPGETPGGAASGPGAGGRHKRNGASAPTGAASGEQGPAMSPFEGASAALGQQPAASGRRQAGGAIPPAAMGAQPEGTAAASGPNAAGNRFQNLSPEERAARMAEWQKLSPEEREARRRQRQQQNGGGTQPAQ
jgi:multidrug efflux system membrane fusion protein